MNEIFEKVSAMAQEINSKGKPEEGTAYLIAAVNTKEESKANTTITLAGKGADVLVLINALLKEESFERGLKLALTTQVFDKLGSLLKDLPKEDKKEN